jgi:8-oxo-dGTP diphosphatase
VIIENGRLLITRRAPGQSLEGLWELPGGKIEPDETPQQCLVRELSEELEMSATVGVVIAQTIHHYDHGSFEMLAMETTRNSDFELRVHDAFTWVAAEEMAEYPLAPADVELVKQIVWGQDRDG